MRTERIKIYLVVVGSILFNWLFWNEKIGINTAIYDLFLLAFLFYLYPDARHSSTVRWLLAGHLICLAMIIVHNTLLSKFGFWITLLLLVAFVQYVHRSLWFATGSIFQNIIFAVPGFVDAMGKRKTKKVSNRKFSRLLRVAFFPLFLLILFFIIYSSANSVFSSMSSRLLTRIENFFGNFFDFFSWYRLLFFLLGLFITTFLLLRSKLNYFSEKEKSYSNELLRVRKSSVQNAKDFLHDLITGFLGKFANGMMALKNMNTIGFISLLLLNVLLIIVNSIDISYIWFGFNAKEVNLYEIIHEGTELLIVSIVMAMMVLLIFFKGNLNFYQKNKWIKRAAYLWIIQNMILVISVFLRDYHYINQTGLAYKRIGVLFYLVLVLIGLVTVFWKIFKRKSTYYLMRVNAWAVIILLVLSSTVNWDEQIANYNLNHQNEIVMPVDFMVTLSGKALPLLDNHKEDLKKHQSIIKEKGQWKYNCDDCFLEILEGNINQYREDNKNYSWLSWNRADAFISNYFNTKNNNSK